MIDVRVLGPLEVARSDGSWVAIASEAQRRLISVLAVDAGIEVRGAVLEDRLGLTSGALRTSISRLRRVIGVEALHTTPSGYALRATVDAVEFERMVATAPKRSDDEARELLEQAVALWRGDPLVELTDEPWAEPMVTRLQEEHAAAVEDLVVLLLDAGEVSTALTAIHRLVADHPYRDRPRALLLRALAASGRRTDALREFQAYRDLLATEVGTAPTTALRDLDRAIAADGGPSVTALGADHPAWSRSRRRALPHGATSAAPSGRMRRPAP